MAERVVVEVARAMAAGGGVDEVTVRQMVRRMVDEDFPRWAKQVHRTGHCARPVRLRGTVLDGSTNLPIYSTTSEPDGSLLVRCGNRRASVCPS